MSHRICFSRWFVLVVLILSSGFAASGAPARVVPAKGIEVPAEKRERLLAEAARLGQQIDALKTSFRGQPKALDLVSDVEIYRNAVRYAASQDIFYGKGDVSVAEELLKQGFERAAQLRVGQAPWTTQTGLIVRGYVSRIDGSVQPYGLVVPETYQPSGDKAHRLDVWHHGRNNKLSELRFISERQTKPGQFTPADAFVLHPYGRYCNAMKFAGEIDTFEALEHAKRHYRIDDDRIAVRGFSMGGAATWHMATHHAGFWAAATPGAGFAETAVYQNIFSREPKPAWWEQKLWRLYDATVYAANLHQCPTIAYSGEKDKQKQAADIMAGFMKKEGLELAHIIGPGMGHKYHPDSKVEIEKRLDAIMADGRERIPRKIRFATYTLRYNRMNWIRVDGLGKHWEEARLDADIVDEHTIRISTKNITAFTVLMEAGLCPMARDRSPHVVIDGDKIMAPGVPEERSWKVRFVKADAGWMTVGDLMQGGISKRHGLQGPIDDAFLDAFLMVEPSGEPMAPELVTRWISGEMADAKHQWLMQFRGEPRTKLDRLVGPDDIRDYNLVLWGDPSSNAIYQRIANKLPIQWTEVGVTVGDQTWPADKHAPVFIFPNPLNPKRYVVINSGFTFAPNGSASNSTQVPKLPDWAVLDITVPAAKRIPAGVVDCDFFGEGWQLVKSKERESH